MRVNPLASTRMVMGNNFSELTMRVLIVHGEIDSGTSPPDELDTLWQADCVEKALLDLGHEVVRDVATLDVKRTLRSWQDKKPDLIFNLIESMAGRTDWAPLGFAMVGMSGIPYAGNSFAAFTTSFDKLAVKSALRSLDLETPFHLSREDLKNHAPILSRPDISRPMIVKASSLGGSIGIDEESIVERPTAEVLLALIEKKTKAHGSVFFAEDYVEGREFKVGLLEDGCGQTEVLKVAELDFSHFRGGRAPILSYDLNWGTDEIQSEVVLRFGLEKEDPALACSMRQAALKVAAAFDLAGWTRMDFRVGRDGSPMLIDINTNCSLAPDGRLTLAARASGIDYTEMIRRLVAPLSLRRG